MAGATYGYTLNGTDKVSILQMDGMSYMRMAEISKGWSADVTLIRVIDVAFTDGSPASYRITFFVGSKRDEFVEFMSNASLTHRIMFIEEGGAIFLTKSEDGRTNIDADLIEAFAGAVQD